MKRKILVLSLILTIIIVVFPYHNKEVVYADSGADTGETTKSPWRTSDNEVFLYQLEAGIPEDEESGFFDIKGKVDDTVVQAKGEAGLLVVNFIFWLNKFLTNGLIVVLDLASDTTFIDKAIEQIGNKVTDIVGISNGRFTDNGMFKVIFQLTSLFVILYAFYKLVWKRSFTESFGEIFKFVTVLVAALLLFTNYTTFISGMNKLGTETSGFIASSATNSGNEERIDGFSESLWGYFVDDPYLKLQYGVDNINELSGGESRVRSLLKAGQGTEKRAEILDEEINERGNYYMTYDSVGLKIFQSFVFLISNGIISIPILMLALALFFTQFWFVIIAMLAPFALLVASFPSLFNVLKRYSFELVLPLLIRIVLGFVLIMLMFLTDLTRDVITDHLAGIGSRVIYYSYANALFVAMLFLGIFLLRKRLIGILSSGSEMVGDIRQGLGNMIINPAKNAVKGSTTLVGATVGGAVAGPQGMMMGAGMGNTVGKMATGGTQGFDGAVKDMTDMSYKYKMLQNQGKPNLDDDKIVDLEGYSENKENQYNETEHNEYGNKDADEKHVSEEYETYNSPNETSGKKYDKYQKKQGEDHFMDYMRGQGFSKQEIGQYKKAFENEGVDFGMLDRDILDNHFNGELVRENNHDPKIFASSVNEELEQLKVDGKKNFNDFLNIQNLTNNEKAYINDSLNDKSIDPAKIPHDFYRDVDQSIRSRMENGEVVDYKTAFVEGIENKIADENQKLNNFNNDDEKLKEQENNKAREGAKEPPTTKLDPNTIINPVVMRNDIPLNDIDIKNDQKSSTKANAEKGAKENNLSIKNSETKRKEAVNEISYEKGSQINVDSAKDSLYKEGEENK